MRRLVLSFALVLGGCAARSRATRREYAGEYRYDGVREGNAPTWYGRLTLDEGGRWQRYEKLDGICYGGSCRGCCFSLRAEQRASSFGRWRATDGGVELRRALVVREPMWAVQHDDATYLLSSVQRTRLCSTPDELDWSEVFLRVGPAPTPAPTPDEVCGR